MSLTSYPELNAGGFGGGGSSTGRGSTAWKSDLILSSSFNGSPTLTFVLAGAGLPTEILLLKAYLETTVTTTSSDEGTSGLTVDIGIAGDESGFAEGLIMMDAPAGRHASSTAADLALTLQVDAVYVARFTATGTLPRLNHVAFSGRVVLVYLPLPALDTP